MVRSFFGSHVPTRIAVAVIAMAIVVAAAFGFGFHLGIAGLTETAVGTCLLVWSSAVALNASRGVSLSRRQATQVVLAGTSANAFTPAGTGGCTIAVRVHVRTGLSGEQAAAAVSIRTVAGSVAAGLVAGFAALTCGLDPDHTLLPVIGWPVAVAVSLVAAGIVGVLAATFPVHATRVWHAIRVVAGAFAALTHEPRRLLLLLTGSVGVIFGQFVALDGAVRAAGGHLHLSGVLIALLGASAAKAALPLPGGIGPVEAALMAGLGSFGVPMGTAGVAVGLYRGVGLWLPVLAGMVALRSLRHHRLL